MDSMEAMPSRHCAVCSTDSPSLAEFWILIVYPVDSYLSQGYYAAHSNFIAFDGILEFRECTREKRGGGELL